MGPDDEVKDDDEEEVKVMGQAVGACRPWEVHALVVVEGVVVVDLTQT